jgi:hypothetical protein
MSGRVVNLLNIRDESQIVESTAQGRTARHRASKDISEEWALNN